MSFRLPTFGPTQMVLTLALLLVGLFAYAFLQTAAQSYRLREAERELIAEVQDLRDQRAELEGLADYLESDEYIEAFARQQFGLVKPGETVVEVDAPAGTVGDRVPGQRWWEALFDTAPAGGVATDVTPTDMDAASAGAPDDPDALSQDDLARD
ncbi:MAG: septum formation initiator family protein [Dehalococcoidia bacterium]|nr:septum formation initiator family protein [Dehalococcoidia bacterium]